MPSQHDVSQGIRKEKTIQPRPSRLFYGWIIVAVSFVTLFLVIGTRFSLGIFYVEILEEYHWTRAETAGAFSLMLVVHALFSLVVGVLFDRLGPRQLFPLGGLTIALGFAACSQIRSLWQFYLFLGIIAALGMSTLAFVPHMALVSSWFVRRRGMASGIAYGGIGSGMLILAPALQSVVSAVGWRHTFLLLAGLVLGVVVPLTAIFQRRRPQDMGLYPDGIVPDAATTPLTTSSSGTSETLHTTTGEMPVRRVLRTPALWLLLLTVVGLGMNLNTLVVHQMAYLTDIGYSKFLGAAFAFSGLGLWGAMQGKAQRRP